jgi:hypothetical protein
LKFQKYFILGYFRANLKTWFLQNEIFFQNGPENTKNGDSDSLAGLEDDFFQF